jgi:adenylate cyclase
LGVRHVIEGSVRRSGDQLRITAQLIEAPTGGHLWAERFDRRIADIFAIQDEIAGAVVDAIEPALAKAERQRVGRKAPENFDTWELYHRGLWHFFKFTITDSRLALEFLHKAASLDPSSAAVQAALGLIYLISGWLFAPGEHTKWHALGLEHGRIAAGLDSLDGMAHAVFGLGLFLSGQHEAAGKETTKAVNLNPTNATVQGLHGCVLGYSGKSESALPHFEQAIRLSPMDTLRWFWVHSSANALYFHGDYHSCAAAGRDVCHMRPDLVYGYRAIVAALGELGRIDEAHQYADLICIKFDSEIREFLTSRWPEWREVDYVAYVASLAKGGLVLRDGALSGVN